MPSLARVKQLAQEVVCRANLRQWGVIWLLYTADNNGSFTLGTHEPAPDPWTEPNMRYWVVVLRPYYGNPGDLTCCPAATKPWTEGGLGPYADWGVYGRFRGGYGGEYGS